MFASRIGWQGRIRRSAGVVLAGALAACAPVAHASTNSVKHKPSGNPVVRTSGGFVRGMTSGTTDEFLGIPYAAPPVGALRWRPPQPAARWHGVRDATSFAPHCPQPGGAFGIASHTSEDCLFLNVFTAAHRESSLAHRPVMVWIHGGALVTGASDSYSPVKLVRDGTVVVTINYRLGALGFLAHPALADQPGGPSGDYGLMDQQAALQWVRQNISRFGGNPRDVTIFGESAGGLSVLSQLASPLAKGLFARAIAQSGSYNPVQAPLAVAEAAGEGFAAAAGCSSQTAACLRSLPVSTILAHETTGGYTPDIDGRVLTQSLSAAFANGQFNRVPVINGTNHDEWRLFVAAGEIAGHPVTAANYQSMIASTLHVSAAAAAAIAARYPLSAFPSPSIALGAVGTDAIFACHALSFDQSLSKFTPTFAYEFNDENAPELFLPPVSFPYGSAHASEIQYVLDLPNVAFPSMLSAAQQQLAATMKAYWSSFARQGFPFSFGAPVWPHFDNATQRMQSLLPPRPQVETDFAAQHQCSFWNAGSMATPASAS